MSLAPVRPALAENRLPTYLLPFVNQRVQHVLKHFHCLHVGEKDSFCVTKVLFLGCNDLRNALQATVDTEHKKPKSLHIHLNDVNPSVLAQNVLLLKIISAADFNPNSEQDMAFLWNVWYNVEWPESTRAKFQHILKDLLDEKMPNVHVHESSQLQSLKKVWEMWYSISADTKPDSKLLKKTLEERCDLISLGIERMSVNTVGKAQKFPTASSFSSKVDTMAKELEENIGVENLQVFLKEKIRDEARRYYQTGSCASLQNESRGFLNPTLLHPTSRKWRVSYALCPFLGYIPLTKEEHLDTSVSSAILTRSCQNILKTLVSSYRKKMDVVQIFIHLEDSLNFCYAETNKFEVIVSYLTDVVGLANIVNACSKILSDHPEANFFTSTTNWTNLAPTIEEYVEKALCSPLSLIPTYYGLRLVDHVELGASALVNLRLPQHPFSLYWKKAPLYRNTSLTLCTTMITFLEDLTRICFDRRTLRRISGLLPGDECGMLMYSPRTFYYVMSAMMERIGGSEELLKDSLSFQLPESFSLMRMALEALMDGRPVFKLSTHIPSSAFEKTFVNAITSSSPPLRVVLVPRPNSGTTPVVNSLQHIDNFEFVMEKNADEEITSVFVSFLLPLGIEETFAANIVDFVNGYDIFNVGPILSFRMEQVCGSYPYHLKTHNPPVAAECIEDKFEYVLKVNVDGDISGSNLLVTTNQQKPCESAHEITLKLGELGDMMPLTLSFPYPFVAEQIHLYRKDRLIELKLKKALREPWPCEFQVNSKWDASALKKWVEIKGLKSLESHLRSQVNLFKHPSEKTKTTPLEEVRQVIFKIFLACIQHSHDIVLRIQLKEPKDIPDVMLIRIHPPLVTSPMDSPTIILSVVDYQFAKTRKEFDNFTTRKDFLKLTPGYKGKNTDVVVINTPEEAELFRYVLRINSTKMLPSNWQKKNLPVNGPWLATFLSPLYLDSPFYGYIKSISKPVVAVPLLLDQSICASCKLKPPKLLRCSRCRSVSYCSLECQRAHWTQHKSNCARKD